MSEWSDAGNGQLSDAQALAQLQQVREMREEIAATEAAAMAAEFGHWRSKWLEEQEREDRVALTAALVNKVRDDRAFSEAFRDALAYGEGWIKTGAIETPNGPEIQVERVEPNVRHQLRQDLEGTIAAASNVPAKPVLIVPAGCVLLVPDDPAERQKILDRYEVRVEPMGGMVSRGFFIESQAVDKVVEAAERVEQAETRRTHAALTFEQPIQNRLGRMAR